MNKETTCSFTGHRTIEKNKMKPLKNQLTETIQQLIHKGFVSFCSGGALGFDLLAAQTVIRLRKNFPQVQLVMVLPCKEQDRFWDDAQKKLFQNVLSEADRIIYTAEFYQKGCMQKRNRYLVDCSSAMVAFLERDTGGTKYTVDYADKKLVPVIFLQNKSKHQLSVFNAL